MGLMYVAVTFSQARLRKVIWRNLIPSGNAGPPIATGTGSRVCEVRGKSAPVPLCPCGTSFLSRWTMSSALPWSAVTRNIPPGSLDQVEFLHASITALFISHHGSRAAVTRVSDHVWVGVVRTNDIILTREGASFSGGGDLEPSSTALD